MKVIPILLFCFLGILLMSTLSCQRKQDIQVKFGCDPPCAEKPWLTFSYDCAYIFQDTTGAIKSALVNDTLLQYTRHHDGMRISEENIAFINQALSCSLWTCVKTPTRKELYDPENIIVFVQSTVPVGYLAICSQSKIVDCNPQSDNRDFALFSTLLHEILHKD